jgi:hypothetical protein
MNFVDAWSSRFGFFDVGVNFVMSDLGVAGLDYVIVRWSLVRAAVRFSGNNYNDRGTAAVFRGNGGRLLVPVSVVVILEIFENVADVQEGIAIQADIDECRLHTGKNASDSAFVDAADQRELFFALDIDFD